MASLKANNSHYMILLQTCRLRVTCEHVVFISVLYCGIVFPSLDYTFPLIWRMFNDRPTCMPTRVYFLFIILGQDTNPSATAKNTGIVFFDSGLNFRKRICKTCRACFYHIRDLRRIRKKSVLRSYEANFSGTGQ